MAPLALPSRSPPAEAPTSRRIRTDNALQYLPKDAPFVAAIGTDLEGDQAKALEGIVKKFPFGSAAVGQIQKQIEKQAGDFDTLKGLLGNDFVVGSTNAKDFVGTPSGDDESWVGAIEAKDGDKLEDQVKKEGKADGEKDGAKFYKTDDSEVAVQDGTLIVAGNRKELEAAIERHGGDDHFTEDDFEKGIGNLPKDSRRARLLQRRRAARVRSGHAADARKVKWVTALEGFGLGASATSDSINAEFNLTTKPGLSAEDLPLAAGSASPQVVERKGAVGVGVKGAGQIVTFAESAGKAISPGGFGQYEAGQAADREGDRREPRRRPRRPAQGRSRRQRLAQRQVRRACGSDRSGGDGEDARRSSRRSFRRSRGRDRREGRLRQARRVLRGRDPERDERRLRRRRSNRLVVANDAEDRPRDRLRSGDVRSRAPAARSPSRPTPRRSATRCSSSSPASSASVPRSAGSS